MQALWRVLEEKRCTVSEIGDDRWVKARFYNPRRGERGKSYTFAAGVLDDVWGFDPGVFGLSPREAENMDPQQRILLQVVWESLEDAGVAPSALAGQNVGVYVGVSSPDTATRRANDVGSADAYTMTGSTLSLVANRLSYVFDWHGPSFSVDTACSSSLVAFSQALDALQAGHIDTAVVAGVNMLLSPFPFLGFAAARMLAPDGRCRPFDADGQGYVRAEGAVALVLHRRDAAPIGAGRRYAEAVAAAVNSDGRTSGVSLPSAEAQAALLRTLYARAGVDPETLAFVEAHGTGTRVGDPAEAEAIGTVLGKSRRRPLPIGSIKSNIGHLEPAAGLAGVMKALLALEHGELPASLHFRTPNPAIAFRDLNIAVAGQPVGLEIAPGVTTAGVSAFGFGGTNAHVILRAVPAEMRVQEGIRTPAAVPAARRKLHVVEEAPAGAGVLMLSAQCREGLAASAEAARHLIAAEDADAALAPIAAAYAAEREQLPERVVVLAKARDEALAALEAFTAGRESPAVITGRAVGRGAPVAFVYTGNGSQWAGMGRLAYETNALFRDRFDVLSSRFGEPAGWSLKDALYAEDLAGRLGFASTAQPLLFAVQAALTDALVALGLEPAVVVGHSVGEIAAAYACGALDESAALRVIAARSSSQELARGSGTMAALAMPEAEARALIADCDAKGRETGVEIGAINSPRSVTLSGPVAGIEACASLAAERGARVKVLDLAYPFHSALVDVARQPLLDELQDVDARAARIPFVSTVTGTVLAGDALDADYWWRNVRSPVRFGDGIGCAAALGARVFVEISPRAILQGYLAESLGDLMAQSALVASLGPKDDLASDPVRATLARGLVRGARVDADRTFGRERADVRLPLYPWQNKPYDLTPSPEAAALMLSTADRHRYLGWRERAGEPQWFCHFDTDLMPELGDHRIGGLVYVPGAVMAEMAIAAAQAWLGDEPAEVYDFDILAPLVLAADHMREVRTAIEPGSRSLQIASRRRMSDEAWQVHVEARIGPLADIEAWTGVMDSDAGADVPAAGFDPAGFYALARSLGLDYGPNFRRLGSIETTADDGLVAGILPQSGNAGGLNHDYRLDPIALDVAFHGLLYKLLGSGDGHRGAAYVPIRFGRIVAFAPARKVHAARLKLTRLGITTARCDVLLLDSHGAPVAVVQDARFKAATFVRNRPLSEIAVRLVGETAPLAGVTPTLDLPATDEIAAAADGVASMDTATASDEARLLLEAAARRVAIDIVTPLVAAGRIEPRTLLHAGRVSPSMLVSLEGLLGALEAAGLAVSGGGEWTLDEGCSALPPLDAIIQTVIADHPQWWPDCALLAEAAAAWPSKLAGGPVDGRALPYSAGVQEAFAVATPRVRDAADRVRTLTTDVLEQIARTAAGQARPARVLEIGAAGGALTVLLARALARCGGELVAIDDDPRAVEKLRSQLAGTAHARVLEPKALAEVMHGGFDLVVSAGGLHRISDLDAVLAMTRNAATGDALVIAAVTPPDTFHDVVLGLDPGWFTPGSPGALPVGRLLSVPAARRRLTSAGFDVVGTSSDDVSLLIGRLDTTANGKHLPAERSAGQRLVTLAALGTGPDGLTASIARVLRSEGVEVAGGTAVPLANGKVDVLLGQDVAGDLMLASSTADPAADPTKLLRERLAALTAVLHRIGERTARLWIITAGALRDQTGDGDGCSVNAAIAAFARTAANEMPKLDVRVVDHAAGLDGVAVAQRIARLIAAPGTETEIVLRAQGLAVLRAERGLAEPGQQLAGDPADDAARLDLSRDPGAERLGWHRVRRRAPAAGEVEIEVVATGLNFRDCMWSMGLLPEEALEDGFAGPTLGFECSGRIVRVGAGVEDFRGGEAVIAFAPAAFASHVTVAAGAVARVPAHMDLTAAATVPVPFITAYYALEHLARLEAGESVLIHGGAGGVGLAALQIAKWRGAVVFATAGSEDKRRLLTLLGADHVLDSRSLAFADEVMAATGGAGVDVVLNSLAGEAMERSLALVRPFGRFLELGKRDFYGATKIGLRPFRRNVSYYGIDADQLLAQKPELSSRLFADLTRYLADGTFVPLPYRRFEASAVGDAFRLMQQSGHIGKIVVTPPSPEKVPAETTVPVFTADAEGIHVVIGGLGGFGLATAQWLLDSGARRLVLVGRTGKPAASDEDQLASLRASGAEITVEAADATDEGQLSALLQRARARAPIRGIIHAAMVLDDDFISRLDAGRIGKVLAPKVAAATHLDRLTRGDALQYFVLYSSVTVLIGNPGQAAYVAANAFLESLARRRRAAGLAALAVGWGGITDTGYLARNADVGRAIERRTGTGSFTAHEALAHLSELIARGDGAPAAVTVAPMSWGAVREQLPLLGKPLFSRLLAGEAATGAARSETIDIAAEISGLDEAGAREVVVRHLAEEVARIFRMPVADVSPSRSLAELGMDSLMGLELRLAVQQRIGADIPLAAMSGNQTLSDISARITGSLRSGGEEPRVTAVNADLVHQHVAAGMDADKLAPLLREIDRRDTTAGAR